MQAADINRANQLNPSHPLYYQCRGMEPPADLHLQHAEKKSGRDVDQATLDNRSKQMNPNNELYYKSRSME